MNFGRRRLSISAKSAGMTVMTSPHPLWGRVDDDFAEGGIPSVGVRGVPLGGGGRQDTNYCSPAVPVLFYLSNEVERMRIQLQASLDHSNAF